MFYFFLSFGFYFSYILAGFLVTFHPQLQEISVTNFPTNPPFPKTQPSSCSRMARGRAKKPIEIDGRTLEGGGQLIRIALCLSALTGIPIKITEIRGNRSRGGGLKAQHLACVNWLAHASNAKVDGAKKGSKTLVFEPRGIHGDLSPAYKKRTLPDGRQIYETRLDIGTAGSTSLALQAVLPFILFCRFPVPLPVQLTISGGTNVSGSPSYEYIAQVLLPALHQIGFPPMTASLKDRGWSHGGGSSIGSFTVEIPPRKTLALPAFSYGPTAEESIQTKLSPPSKLHATFIAPPSAHASLRSALPKAVTQHFSSQSAQNLTIECEDSHHAKRIYLIMAACIPFSPKEHILATDWLYDRRIPENGAYDAVMIKMSDRVTSSLASEWCSQASVDVHLRDQLVVFQALASGNSRMFVGWGENRDASDTEITVREDSLHAQTAEWVSRLLLRAKFDGKGGCEGIGVGGEEVREGNDEASLSDMERLRVE